MDEINWAPEVLALPPRIVGDVGVYFMPLVLPISIIGYSREEI